MKPANSPAPSSVAPAGASLTILAAQDPQLGSVIGSVQNLTLANRAELVRRCNADDRLSADARLFVRDLVRLVAMTEGAS